MLVRPGPADDTVVVLKETECEGPFPDGRDTVLAQATKTTVAIVTQTCDIQRKETVTVALVMPIPTGSTDAKLAEMRRWDKHLSSFYLAPDTASGFEGGVVHFGMLYSMPSARLRDQADQLVVSLSHDARAQFQYKLSVFFGRPAVE